MKNPLITYVIFALAVIASAVILSGCSVFQPMREQVPIAEGSIDPATGKFAWKNPKDLGVRGFHYIRNADGSVEMVLDSMDSRMNPDIITMTGDANAKNTAAIANGMSQVAGAVISGLASSGTIPAAKAAVNALPQAAAEEARLKMQTPAKLKSP